MFGIEDDVFGRKPDLVDENPVSALADADLVFVSRSLALLVEGHHHRRRAILQHRGGVLAKLLFAFLQRDRIHDALALQALQPGLDDLPLRGVHHERNLGDFGLAGQQLQKARHRGDAVDHALVHADVDDVRAVLHLLPGHADRFFVFAFLDQLGELRRTGHIGPLADHDVDAGLLRERLRSRQTKRLGSNRSASVTLTTSVSLDLESSGEFALICAEAGLRAPWQSPRCAPACCRSIRRQY